MKKLTLLPPPPPEIVKTNQRDENEIAFFLLRWQQVA
jgi:hypothetical protein